MSDWVRWLLVGLGLFLVIALVVLARGERQRDDVESGAPAVVVDIPVEAGRRFALVERVSWS